MGTHVNCNTSYANLEPKAALDQERPLKRIVSIWENSFEEQKRELKLGLMFP